MKLIKTFLKLGRVSNLPTAWSNALLGATLAEIMSPIPLVFILIGASAAYIGGMFLNDAFDADYDRKRQPHRPIPKGEVSEGLVYLNGFLLLGLSIYSFWMAGKITAANLYPWGYISMGALVLAIVAYNALHKEFSQSFVLMGLSRALLVSTVALSLGSAFDRPLWISAGVPLVYVSSFTFLAARRNKFPFIKGKVPYFIAGIALIDAILVYAFTPYLLVAGLCVMLAVMTVLLNQLLSGD